MLAERADLRLCGRRQNYAADGLPGRLREQIGRVLGLPLRQEPIEVCTLHSLRLGSASSQHGADFVQRERPVRIVRVHERHVQTIGVPRIWRQLFWAASSSHGTSLAER
jgi:hypothetical protein